MTGATSGARERFQNVRIFVGIVVTEEADRVDSHIRVTRPREDLMERRATRVVVAVAEEYEHFARPRPSRETIETGEKRVVERCTALRHERGQSRLQGDRIVRRQWAAGQRIAHSVVELDCEHLVLRIAPSHEGQRRGDDF